MLGDLLTYEFLRNALAASVLASVLCGVVGTFVVVKRLVFISGGISHAAFGGLGICLFFGIDPRLGAAAVAVGSALVLSRVEESRSGSRDATIGLLWAVGMAVGVVFLARAPGYAPNLMSYLFGNVLAVSPADVGLTFALATSVLLLLAAFSKELVAVAFDEPFAQVQGVRVGAFRTLLLVMVALSVVFLIQLVGIILVIALLTIPPLAALRLARSFPGVILTSMAVGLVMTVGGLALSYAWDVPSGATMVLLGAVLLLATVAWKRWRGRR
ncbi:MAG TPA: metal ABC transporter permease [Thermoanaerobaculia bacterium]|nr:metal ABC transporter permease [Thermoanaerobaculia bacterium]